MNNPAISLMYAPVHTEHGCTQIWMHSDVDAFRRGCIRMWIFWTWMHTDVDARSARMFEGHTIKALTK